MVLFYRRKPYARVGGQLNTVSSLWADRLEICGTDLIDQPTDQCLNYPVLAAAFARTTTDGPKVADRAVLSRELARLSHPGRGGPSRCGEVCVRLRGRHGPHGRRRSRLRGSTNRHSVGVQAASARRPPSLEDGDNTDHPTISGLSTCWSPGYRSLLPPGRLRAAWRAYDKGDRADKQADGRKGWCECVTVRKTTWTPRLSVWLSLSAFGIQSLLERLAGPILTTPAVSPELRPWHGPFSHA